MRVFLHKSGRRWLLAGTMALWGAGVACAPLQTSVYIREAERALAQAGAQEAQSRAPYAWTMAELYLEKAREKNGYAQYEQAMAYSKKAKHWALAAAMQTTQEPP